MKARTLAGLMELQVARQERGDKEEEDGLDTGKGFPVMAESKTLMLFDEL